MGDFRPAPTILRTPLAVPIAVSIWSAIVLAEGVPVGLVERGDSRPGEWEPWKVWQVWELRLGDLGREFSGRLRKASDIAELVLRVCCTGGVRRIGSSTVDMGD